MPSEIFASYSREDQAQVFPIVDKLRERGLNIWIDQEGIHGAKLWSQEIVNAIENSKVFILFASTKTFASKNVTKELALASESDKHILPIFIEDAEIPTAMKYQLAGIQSVELYKLSEDVGFGYIIKSLEALGISIIPGKGHFQERTPEPLLSHDRHLGKSRSKRQFKGSLAIAIGLIAILVVAVGVLTRKEPAEPTNSRKGNSLNAATNQTLVLEKNLEWYRTNAVPRIIKFVELSDYENAFKLASDVSAKVPNDPLIESLWDKFSVEINITIEPSDCIASYREYSIAKDKWKPLDLSKPKIRLPLGAKLLRIEKEQFVTSEVLLNLTQNNSNKQFHFVLHEFKDSYKGMVYIPGGENRPILFGQHLFSEKPHLDGFFLDKFEVTNREYKSFVDAGAYRRNEFWKHEIKDDVGMSIDWEEAMRLFVDRTQRPGPATWELSTYPEGKGQFPVRGISWYEAAAYAVFTGKSLPSIHHWIQAAGLQNSPLILPQSNLTTDSLKPVGQLGGPSPWGAYDMAGNVAEWCYNPTGKGEDRFALGGAWVDAAYWFFFSNAIDPRTRNEKTGFRCIRPSISTEFPVELFAPVPVIHRDFTIEKPCSDEIFSVYKKRFDYDQIPLEPQRMGNIDVFETYTRETLTINAAYNSERLILHVFLPKNGVSPYQTVIGFPGSGAARRKDSKEMRPPPFTINSNRAYVFPVYKGTYERNDGMKSTWPEQTHTFANNLTKWVMDFRRTVDYVESRKDLQHNKLGYYGYSWGSRMGPFILSVEKRVDVAILLVGGLAPVFTLPEVDQINYITRVKCPVLMLNGRFDGIYPVETAQRPFYEFLGTSPEHKRHLIYDTTHNVPTAELNKESVEWLDKYLGPSIDNDN